MDEKNITTLQDDLTDEFYVLALAHSEKILKILEEFDDDQLQFAIDLEAYEKDRTKPNRNPCKQVLITKEDEPITMGSEEQQDKIA